MAEINREKVIEAEERLCKIFNELHLTVDEKAVVAYSAAKRFDAFQRLEKDAKEKPQEISKVQIFTAVCSTLAIIISIIAVLLK